MFEEEKCICMFQSEIYLHGVRPKMQALLDGNEKYPIDDVSGCKGRYRETCISGR